MSNLSFARKNRGNQRFDYQNLLPSLVFSFALCIILFSNYESNLQCLPIFVIEFALLYNTSQTLQCLF